MRARLERSKRKRKRNVVQVGADVDASMSSAAAWVKRSKTLPAPSSSSSSSSLSSTNPSTSHKNDYKSSDLEGIVVSHDLSAFKEGESVILTLADSSVLDDDTPMELQNANMADDDRLNFRKDRLRRLNKPHYAAYADGEDDDDGLRSGLITKPKMLAHYDQEDQEKSRSERKKTTIGSGGLIDPAKKKEAEEIAERLRAAKMGKKLESVKGGRKNVAREFLTSEEVSFKKKKKKKKKSKKRSTSSSSSSTSNNNSSNGSSQKEMSLADELEARALTNSSGNHGTRESRAQRNDKRDELADELEEHDRQMVAFNRAMKISWKQQTSSKIGGMGDRLIGETSSNNDETSNEMILAKEMAMKRQQDEEKAVAEKKRRSEAVLGLNGKHADDQGMILSDTVQFTTQLKSRILQMAEEQEQLEVQRAEQLQKQQEKDAILKESQKDEDGDVSMTDSSKNASMSSSSSSSTTSTTSTSSSSSSSSSSSKNETNAFTSREPLASSGLAASLQLLRRTNNLGSKSSGQDVAFARTGTTKVKTEVTSGKQGSIKYEHRDSEGNLLTTQEAWRLQNYVFHGINPGKRKLDKRKAKLEAAKKSQNQSAIKKTEALRNNLKHHGQAFVSIQGKASSGGNNGGSKGGGKK